MYGIACGDCRGGDRERRLQFLECFCGRETREIFFHALVGGQPEPGRSPAPEIREARTRSNVGHFIQRCPRAVSHGDQRADAGTGYTIDRDFSLAQNAEHAKVCDSACKAACKGQADSRAFLGFAVLAVREGAKLFLCCSKPAQTAGASAFFRHFSILVLSPRMSPSFDPRMPVLYPVPSH